MSHSHLPMIFWQHHTLTVLASTFGTFLPLSGLISLTSDNTGPTAHSMLKYHSKALRKRILWTSHYLQCKEFLRTKVFISFECHVSSILNFPLALDDLQSLTLQDTPSDVFATPPQLDGELVTLTLLPRSRWQTLLNLEVIQVPSL